MHTHYAYEFLDDRKSGRSSTQTWSPASSAAVLFALFMAVSFRPALAQGPARSAALDPNEIPLIKIERLASCDLCGHYEIRFYDDGFSFAEGREGVLWRGQFGDRGTRTRLSLEDARGREARIARRDRLLSLARYARARGFFGLSDSYLDPTVRDKQISAISIALDGERKTVTYQQGVPMPVALEEIAERIEAEFKDAYANLSISRSLFLPTGLFESSPEALAKLYVDDPAADGTVLIVYRDGRVVYVGRRGNRLDPSSFGVYRYTIDPAQVKAIEREFERLRFAELQMYGRAVPRAGKGGDLTYKMPNGMTNTIFFNSTQQTPEQANEAKRLLLQLADVERVACVYELGTCPRYPRID